MDSGTRTLDDVLRALNDGLRDLYGGRYRGLVLYGSSARGEAEEGSDVDLLSMLLEGPVEVGKEIRRSSALVASLALEAGLVLSLIPVSVEDHRASLDPYLIDARTEGAVLSPTPPDERRSGYHRKSAGKGAALPRCSPRRLRR